MTIQTTRTESRYTDIYTNLDAHPVRKDIFVLSDADAVKTSIKNILFTDRFERFFNPLFGSNIKRSLFENMTPSTEMDVRMFVETAIRNFEPRVDYLEVYVNAIPDENGYYLKVIFSIVNNPQLETLNLILNRVR